VTDADPAILRWSVLMLTLVVGLVTTIVQNRRTKTQVAKVEALSAPTGNGYAKRTEAALKNIVGRLEDLTKDGGRLDRIEGKVDRHIADHASADVHRQPAGP